MGHLSRECRVVKRLLLLGALLLLVLGGACQTYQTVLEKEHTVRRSPGGALLSQQQSERIRQIVPKRAFGGNSGVTFLYREQSRDTDGAGRPTTSTEVQARFVMTFHHNMPEQNRQFTMVSSTPGGGVVVITYMDNAGDIYQAFLSDTGSMFASLLTSEELCHAQSALPRDLPPPIGELARKLVDQYQVNKFFIVKTINWEYERIQRGPGGQVLSHYLDSSERRNRWGKPGEVKIWFSPL